jgi:hypothetical protein
VHGTPTERTSPAPTFLSISQDEPLPTPVDREGRRNSTCHSTLHNVVNSFAASGSFVPWLHRHHFY